MGKDKCVMDVTAYLAGLERCALHWGDPIWAMASKHDGPGRLWIASFDLTQPGHLLREEDLAREIIHRGLGAPQLISQFNEAWEMTTATRHGAPMPVDQDE